MDFFGLNFLDYGVLAVILVSGLLALSRGLVKEVVSIAVWVGAVLATLYGFAYVQPIARNLISFRPLADGVAGVALFLIALVALSLAGRSITNRLREGGLSAIDRSAGLLFGLLRGGIIVSLLYLFTALIEPETKTYDIVQSSRTAPLLEYGSNLLLRLVPDGAIEAGTRAVKKAGGAETAKEGAGEAGPGYKHEERREMERLILELQ